jgi:hypothetical protein
MRNLYKLESLTPYTNYFNQGTRLRGSSNTHKRPNHSNTCTRVKKRAQEIAQRSYNSKTCSNLYLAKQQRGLNVSVLLDAQRMLSVLLHAPRGSFYSPKGQRGYLFFNWKELIAFCSWVHRTVQCTPDSEQSLISFLLCPRRLLSAVGTMAHRTL